MTDQQPIAEGESQAVASAEPGTEMSDKPIEPPSRSPYLKVFGADIGVSEFELPYRTITIGRSGGPDILLPNPSVSRAHATITRKEGQFIVADAGSTCGTKVNGKPIENHVLEHGDSIQIATYVLQFRTHDELSGTEKAVSRAKAMLRGDYCTLPSTMRAKFRTLSLEPPSTFESGDTIRIGQGGLVIPTSTRPGDDTCLELELSITRRVSRQFIGSIMGIIQEEGTRWMCVKLHTIAKEKHQAFVASAEAGPWIDIVPT